MERISRDVRIDMGGFRGILGDMRLFRQHLLIALTIVLALLPACPKSVMAMSDRAIPSAPMQTMMENAHMISCDGAQFDGPTPACCLFHGGDSTSDRVKSASVPQPVDTVPVPMVACLPIIYPEVRYQPIDRSDPATAFFERSTNQRE